MDVKPLVKGLLARNREVLESTMADVESEHAHWAPQGKALPLGALYIHVLTAEDFFIQGMLKGGAPLWESSWKGNMGLSEPRPPRGQPWEDWARRVRMDMPKLREYGKAVFSPLHHRATIDLADGRHLEAVGNIVDKDFEIRDGDQVMAQVSRAWFRVRDTYGVDVAPREDDVLMICIAVCLDRIHDEEEEQRDR